MSIWAWGENFGFLVEGQKKFDEFNTVRHTIVDALHRHGDFPKNSHFKSAIAKFLTLKISHLESQVTDKMVVKKGRSRSRDVRGDKTRKRSSFHTEDKLLIVVTICVGHCRLVGFQFWLHCWFVNMIFFLLPLYHYQIM